MCLGYKNYYPVTNFEKFFEKSIDFLNFLYYNLIEVVESGTKW